HLPTPTPKGLKPRHDLLLRVFDCEPIEKRRVSQNAIARICLESDAETLGVRPHGNDDGPHGQVIFMRKIEIALIVRGATENGASAILHENKVGDVDREFPILRKRVQHLELRQVTLFLRTLDRGLARPEPAAFFDKGPRLRIFRSDRLGERMIRRECYEARPKE